MYNLRKLLNTYITVGQAHKNTHNPLVTPFLNSLVMLSLSCVHKHLLSSD
jgi:hypothetical protein